MQENRSNEALCGKMLRTVGNAASAQEAPAIYAGSGPCTLCSCDGFADDGSGFSRCKCGDRKMDHRSQDNEDLHAAAERLIRATTLNRSSV